MPQTLPGPRDRLVYTAVQQLRQHGVTATGLRGLVADAAAPWGSLRHYFPGGKDQLITEALGWAGSFAADRVDAYLADVSRPTPSGLFADLVQAWVRDLEMRAYERGCPVAAAVVDSADVSEAIRCAAAQALEQWRAPLVRGLVTMGVARDRAEDLATLMLCSLEGALIMARAGRTMEPLHAIQRTVGSMLDDEPRPAAGS
jgi:AcrR family transcriptional regulator